MFLKEQARLSELNGTQGTDMMQHLFVKNFNHAGLEPESIGKPICCQ